MKFDILAQVLAWLILAARECLWVTLTIAPSGSDDYEMNDVRGGTRCGEPSSSVVAPFFYALLAARRRCGAVRSAAPEHIRMRRRALRSARDTARSAASYSAKVATSFAPAAADDVRTPSPLGPVVGRSRPSNILSAAAEGVGAFHAAQTAALKSCSAGFVAYLAAYLEQEMRSLQRSYYQCHDLSTRRRAEHLVHPDAAPDVLPHAPL